MLEKDSPTFKMMNSFNPNNNGYWLFCFYVKFKNSMHDSLKMTENALKGEETINKSF